MAKKKPMPPFIQKKVDAAKAKAPAKGKAAKGKPFGGKKAAPFRGKKG